MFLSSRSVLFNPLTDWVVKGVGGVGEWTGHEERFRRDPLPVFSAGGPCEQVLASAGMSTL